MSDPIVFEVGMSTAAVELLVESLKKLLVSDANLILNVKQDLEYLYSDLIFFKSFLKDSMMERGNKNKTLKELVNKIRDVAYEVEDTVDEFVAQAAAHKNKNRNPFERAFTFHRFQSALKLRSASKKIASIKEKIASIMEKVKLIYYYKNKFGVQALQDDEEGSAKNTKVEKALSLTGEAGNVVGFRDEAKNVTSLLAGGPNELQVISLVGMGGIGKTTLARKIFCDSIIRHEFYYRAWVNVSAQHATKEVFRNIISQFSKSDDEKLFEITSESLANKLRKTLEKRKYLIVLDDVWTTGAWDDLKIGFPHTKMGSRILLTTRNMEVARHANPRSRPCMLRFLNHDESWILFLRESLGSEKCPRELLEHAERIVSKCQGLPLAIVTIGRALLQKGTGSSWWEKVVESVNHIAADHENQIEQVIALSFDMLPYHLKACFLYLGVFPEDFQITAWRLIRLWIAEGFIQQQEGMSLEDIAEEYLEDLVNRNLVMVGKRKSNGKVKTCHVHELLREFCMNLAAKENFFRKIECFDQVTHSSSNLDLTKQRRLLVHSHSLNYLPSKLSIPHLRSFLCFSTGESSLPPEDISSFLRAFKLLKVLDSKPINCTHFPRELTQLVHLKYLILSINFKILPASISNLHNIQTLVIETKSRTIEIKADILKMIQLRHFKTNASTFLPSHLAKRRKDALKNRNLRTFSTLSLESCTEDVFDSAPYLQKLSIHGQLAKHLEVKGGPSLFDSLGKLDRLQNLKLSNDVFPNPPSDGKVISLPRSYQFPPKLAKLTLASTMLDWIHMSELGMLESLEILKLKDNAFVGERWQTEGGGFRILKVLHIETTDLNSWEASAHHFPRLRSLSLISCSKLAEVPLGLADVSSLQMMQLYLTTKSAAASARKIQQHKQKMQDQQDIQFELFIDPPDEDQSLPLTQA